MVPNGIVGIGEFGFEQISRLESYLECYHSGSDVKRVLACRLANVDTRENNNHIDLRDDFSTENGLGDAANPFTLDIEEVTNLYSDLVNIENDDSVSERLVINLVCSAGEKSSISIINAFSEEIGRMSDRGQMQCHLRVFCFLEDKSESIVVREYLDEISNCFSKWEEDAVRNVFLIDAQNVDAMYLNMDERVQTFTLAEFIIMLATEEYDLLANLKRNFLLSFGLSSLFYDKQFYFFS